MCSRYVLGVLISLSALTGCITGGNRSEPLVPQQSYEGEEQAAEPQAYAESRSARRSSEEAKAPSAPGSSADRAFEPPSDERPGLGTRFGETRTSFVSSVSFERESDTPFSVLTLHYNDAAGVRAMTRRLGSDFGTFRIDRFSAGQGAVTVRLLDGGGEPLPSLEVGGHNYVIGEDGSRYIIQIRNNTRVRLEAVATVDGLDVIDGRPGNFEKRGYLINPHSTIEIDGFRQSTDSVAAFRFGSVRESYAARTGDDRNVGVIGIAIFPEAGAEFPWSPNEVRRRRDADPFPDRFAQPPPL